MTTRLNRHSLACPAFLTGSLLLGQGLACIFPKVEHRPPIPCKDGVPNRGVGKLTSRQLLLNRLALLDDRNGLGHRRVTMSMFVAEGTLTALDLNTFATLLSCGVIDVRTEVPVSISCTGASATDQRSIGTAVLVALALAALRQLRHPRGQKNARMNWRFGANCTSVQPFGHWFSFFVLHQAPCCIVES